MQHKQLYYFYTVIIQLYYCYTVIIQLYYFYTVIIQLYYYYTVIIQLYYCYTVSTNWSVSVQLPAVTLAYRSLLTDTGSSDRVCCGVGPPQ